MRRTYTLFTLLGVVTVALTLALGATVLFAADPAGANPTNAILLNVGAVQACVPQTIPPGGQVWFQIPYNAGKDLSILATGADGVNLDVYDILQVASYPNLGQPVGRLTPNGNITGTPKNWQGHLASGNVSAFYYVLATNPLPNPVTFSICTQETEIFTPPPQPSSGPACASGYVLNAAGQCVLQPVCDSPKVLDTATNQCVCGPNGVISQLDGCIPNPCPPGYRYFEGDGGFVCIPPNPN